MRVRLRRGILNCSVRLWVPGSTVRCDARIGADYQARLAAHPRGEIRRGVKAFAATMVLGALARTASYAVLGQGIGWGLLATILIAASIGRGHLSFASAFRKSEGGGRAVARPPPPSVSR
jgi:hypothetical protein